MLMAEVEPSQDDRTEALPQSSPLFLLAAQQRDTLTVFPHAGQGIAKFSLRLVHALGNRDEAARHQDDRRAGDERVNDRRDHQVAGDDDACRRRSERQIATDEPEHPDERHRRDRGAEDADDEVDRRIGGDTRIVTDAALGILMVSRHQIELVVVAICQPSCRPDGWSTTRATHAGLSCARTRRRWPAPPWSPQASTKIRACVKTASPSFFSSALKMSRLQIFIRYWKATWTRMSTMRPRVSSQAVRRVSPNQKPRALAQKRRMSGRLVGNAGDD